MKVNTTIICLTIITIFDEIFCHSVGLSFWLWVLYAFYKMNQITNEENTEK